MGSKKAKIDIGADKRVIRGSGPIGSGDPGVPTPVDVKDVNLGDIPLARQS
jgi:hypothetical protein